MQRVSALWQASPRKLVGALFILMLAAMMAVASGASFTSTSANAGNVVTAGTMKHRHTTRAAARSSTSPASCPGTRDYGTVTLSNTGDGDGVFTLSQEQRRRTPTPPGLLGKLDLVIDDVDQPERPVDHLQRQARRHARPRHRVTRPGRQRDVQVHRHVPRRRHALRPHHAATTLQEARRHGRLRLGARSASNDPVARDHRYSSPRAGTMAGRGLMSVLLLLTLAAMAVTFVPGLMGYQRYVLVGSSMEPTIHRGSLVFDRDRARSRAAQGRRHHLRPARPRPARHPPPHLRQAPEEEGPRPLFRTQGDNVADPDMRAFKLDKPTQARYSFAVPYLGWLFIALGTPQAAAHPAGGSGAVDRAGHARATVARRRQARRRTRTTRCRRRARGRMRCAGTGRPSQR